MVKVALVQLSKKHTEIFGTFIEIFKKNNYELTIYYDLDNDPYTFLKYYQKLFNIKLDIRPTNKLINDKSQFNFFIFTSSADDVRMDPWFKLPENSNKCIYVQHQAPHWKPYMKKNILMSPVIDSPELRQQKSSYIIPFYKSYDKMHANKDQNNFAIIGAVRPHQKDKDLSLLLELLEKYPDENYKIFVFMRKMDWRVISRRHPFLKNNPHIEFYPGLSTEKMIEKLKHVKFVLPLSKQNGWFYWQRLTGTIPLAINLNMPLIMDKKLAQIYNLEKASITYEKSLCEILNKVLNIKQEDYYKLIENIVIYKKEQYKNNFQEIEKMLN